VDWSSVVDSEGNVVASLARLDNLVLANFVGSDADIKVGKVKFDSKNKPKTITWSKPVTWSRDDKNNAEIWKFKGMLQAPHDSDTARTCQPPCDNQEQCHTSCDHKDDCHTPCHEQDSCKPCRPQSSCKPHSHNCDESNGCNSDGESDCDDEHECCCSGRGGSRRRR